MLHWAHQPLALSNLPGSQDIMSLITHSAAQLTFLLSQAEKISAGDRPIEIDTEILPHLSSHIDSHLECWPHFDLD